MAARVAHTRSSIMGSLTGLLALLVFVNMYETIMNVFRLGRSGFGYTLYTLGLAVVVIVLYLFDLLRGDKMNKFEILVWVFFGFVSLFAIMPLFESGTIAEVHNACTYFFAFCIPGFCAGGLLSRRNRYKAAAKWLDVIMVLLTASTVLFIVSGDSSYQTGVNYQGASYLCALAFGINAHFLFKGDSYRRFSACSGELFRLFQIVLLPAQLLFTLASGGRGGAVLAACYFAYLVYEGLNSPKARKRFVLCVVLATAATVAFVSVYGFSLFEEGIRRVLMLFDAGAISNTSDSATNSISGRNVIRDESLFLISQEPLLGYGLFDYYAVLKSYPHNIVLEVLLQGGITYLIAFSVIAVLVINRARAVSKCSKQLGAYYVIGFYAVMFLLFSGSYLSSAPFWAFVGMVVAFNLNNSRTNNEALTN